MSGPAAALAATGFLLLAAAALATGDALQAHASADTLFWTLGGKLEPTPFFWGTDRNGQLTSWLVRGIPGWTEDQVAQLTLSLAGTLAAPGLIAILLLGPRAASPAMLATLAWLLVMPASGFMMMAGQLQIGLSLALGVAGLLLLAPPDAPAPPWAAWASRSGGMALVALSLFVNEASLAVLGPLALVPADGDPDPGGAPPRPWARVLTALLVLGLAWLATRALGRAYGTPSSTLRSLLPPARWPESLATLAVHSFDGLGGAAATWVTLLATGAALAPRRDPRVRRAGLRAAGIALATGALASGALAITTHVAANQGHPRYGSFAALLTVAAWAALLVAAGTPAAPPAPPAPPPPAPRLPLLAALLAAVALALHGPPSVARVRAGYEARWGARTDRLEALGATRVAGDYWQVWPLVFWANYRAVRRGEAPRVRGWAERSEDDRRRRDRVDPARDRVAVIPPDHPLRQLPPSALGTLMAREPLARDPALAVYALDPAAPRFFDRRGPHVGTLVPAPDGVRIELRRGRDPTGYPFAAPLAPLPEGAHRLAIRLALEDPRPLPADEALLYVSPPDKPTGRPFPLTLASLAAQGGELLLDLTTGPGAAHQAGSLALRWPGYRSMTLHLALRLDPQR